ncbi:hypothetical protein ACWCRH_28535, partial [Streptomyces sp. NPDC002399]
ESSMPTQVKERPCSWSHGRPGLRTAYGTGRDDESERADTAEVRPFAGARRSSERVVRAEARRCLVHLELSRWTHRRDVLPATYRAIANLVSDRNIIG